MDREGESGEAGAEDSAGGPGEVLSCAAPGDGQRNLFW